MPSWKHPTHPHSICQEGSPAFLGVGGSGGEGDTRQWAPRSLTRSLKRGVTGFVILGGWYCACAPTAIWTPASDSFAPANAICGPCWRWRPTFRPAIRLYESCGWVCAGKVLGGGERPTLQAVHRAHATSIPFENLDPHRGIPAKPNTNERESTEAGREQPSELGPNQPAHEQPDERDPDQAHDLGLVID